MYPHLDVITAVLFGLAVVHTFLVGRFHRIAMRYSKGSLGENFFQLIGEVEVVFGLWAGLLIGIVAYSIGEQRTIFLLENTDFTEPLFVFVIMAIASTKPVIHLAQRVVSVSARAIPLPASAAFYCSALVIGPLLGSFITEPAAMTVTALLLKRRIFEGGGPRNFLYLTLGILFVNVSIGGVLTHYAAPPVLMVAGKWGWGSSYMLTHFGWKAAVAVGINAAMGVCFGWDTLSGPQANTGTRDSVPLAVSFLHVFFLAVVVRYAHHPVVFVGAFLFFLGIVAVTREYQHTLKLRESLLVGFFLAGLVVLGSFQEWWLKPLLERLGPTALYLGAAALTAITDNAALTFLGAQVTSLTEAMKYSLVAGAVAGGGLTVIANAPNPAGYSILRTSFGPGGISPLGLFLGALVPTVVALAAFWFLPSMPW